MLTNKDLLDILRIQIVSRQLEIEAIERYVANPENIDAFIQSMQAALGTMRALSSPGVCPDKWIHKDCKCELEQIT